MISLASRCRSTVSSSTAPDTMRSARRGSRPGIFIRSAMPRVGDFFAETMNLLGRDAEVSDLVGRAAAARQTAIVPRLRMVPDVPITRSKPAVRISRRYFVSSSSMWRTSFRSSRPDSGSVWTNRSVSRMTPSLKLRAARRDVPGAVGDLDAPAADIHDHRRGAGHVDAVDGCQVNQASLFGSRNDLRPDAGLPLDGRQELAAVFRFAHGAGGRGKDLFDLVRLGQPPEARKRLERGGHGLARERLAIQSARAQAHHLLLAIDDLEGQIGPDPDHDHVNRVRAAVDRRYPHLLDLERVAGVTRTSYNGRLYYGRRRTRPRAS